jgi:hypothetical protein
MRSKLRSERQRSSSRRARLPSSFFAPTSADARFVIEPNLADLLADVREMSALDDPLQAELFGARLRSTLCDISRAMIDDPDSVVGRTLVRLTERRARPDSVALLCTVAATWPEPVAAHARSAVDRLVEQGVAPPPWAEAVANVEFVAARLGEEPHSHLQVLYVCFEYPGRGRHCFCVLIDRSLGGLLKNVFVTEQTDEAFPKGATHPSFPGVTFRSIDGLPAAALIGSSLEVRRSLSMETKDAPGDDSDDGAVLNLLQARLRVLAPSMNLDPPTTTTPPS